jgi:hypothetical protein
MKVHQIIIGAVALILISFFIYIRSLADKYDWNEENQDIAYLEKTKEPFGISASYHLVKDKYRAAFEEINTPTLSALDKYPPHLSTYVFVGIQPYFDSLETSRLLSFVDKGGVAFLSSKYLSGRLEDSILLNTDCDDLYSAPSDMYHYKTDTIAEVWFKEGSEPRAKYYVPYKHKPTRAYWNALPAKYFCEGAVEYQIRGGYKDLGSNYICIPYGKGSFLIHTLPLAFTNYHILRTETLPYVNELIADFAAEHIYWDSYAKTEEARIKAFKIPNASRSARNNGILKTMLREPALAFSWFILLGMVAMFIVFRSKREQRQIPVIAPNKNTSLQFVRSLASLQFKQQNFDAVCRQDMRYFLSNIRDRAGLLIPMQADGTVPVQQNWLDQVSLSTGYPKQALGNIFTQYEACARYAPTAEMMSELHISIEHFIHFKTQRRK